MAVMFLPVQICRPQIACQISIMRRVRTFCRVKTGMDKCHDKEDEWTYNHQDS